MVVEYEDYTWSGGKNKNVMPEMFNASKNFIIKCNQIDSLHYMI